VAVNGSDTNAGTTLATALRTLQKAHDLAKCGDTIRVLGGTYFQRLTWTKQCSPATPLILEGVRGADGGYTSIVEGTDATSGWVQATAQCGSNCWSIDNPGYSPQGIVATNSRLTVMRLYDAYMGGNCSAGGCTDANGFTTLARSPTSTINYQGTGAVSFWDGIEAAFGVTGGKTYLRFRNGENPSTLNVRIARSGGTIAFSGARGAILRDLEIGGGEVAVLATSGSSDVTIAHNLLRNGENVVNISTGTVNVQVLNNRLEPRFIGSMAGYTATPYEPGNWHGSGSYARMVAASYYWFVKFNVGASLASSQAVVAIVSTATDVLIQGNTIKNVVTGIWWAATGRVKVLSNHIENCSAACLFGEGQTSLDHVMELGLNTIIDADHGFRYNRVQQPVTLYIYGNKFITDEISTDTGAKHIDLESFAATPAQIPSVIWIYHNTFAGRGWAFNVGFFGASQTAPCWRFINNVMDFFGAPGSNGLGQTGFGGKTGVIAWNWGAGSTTSGASGAGCTGAAATNNITATSKLWTIPPIPVSFALPDGHAAKDSALRLDRSFTLGGVSYPPLPGMTDFQRDASPDRGAVQ
jgi:hypothetical protein